MNFSLLFSNKSHYAGMIIAPLNYANMATLLNSSQLNEQKQLAKENSIVTS
jgi:hypothetical protein